MSVRVLVTGSRTWTDNTAITRALQPYRAPGVVLVHGGATGADRIAAGIWRRWGLPTEEHRANWAAHHQAAGMRRNQEMVARGADVCLAFIHNGSAGASHCADTAQRAGIPTHRQRTGDKHMGTDLFGVEVPQQRPTTSGQAPDRVTNDIDEVVAVLRIAAQDGYAVVGVRQQVWRCLADPVVELVARYEADTVRQLLDAGWLTVGGNHVYEYQCADLAGRAVLVPKRATRWLARWDTRRPLGQPSRGR